jgi:Cytochrome C'
MYIHSVKLSVGGVLALSLCLLAGTNSFRADDDDKKAAAAAKEAVIKLAEGKGDAKDIAKNHTLENVMHTFKPAVKGTKGIEGRILDLAKTQLPPGTLKKDAADLAKMMEITRVIGDISAYYDDPAKKNPRAWKKFNAEMIEATKGMQEASKGGNPAKVKTAANRLATSCNECHTMFRD